MMSIHLRLALLALCLIGAGNANRLFEDEVFRGPLPGQDAECRKEVRESGCEPPKSRPPTEEDITAFVSCLAGKISDECLNKVKERIDEMEACKKAIQSVCPPPSEDEERNPRALCECIKENEESLPEQCRRVPFCRPGGKGGKGGRGEGAPEELPPRAERDLFRGPQPGGDDDECRKAVRESGCERPQSRPPTEEEIAAFETCLAGKISDECLNKVKERIDEMEACKKAIEDVCPLPKEEDKDSRKEFCECIKAHTDDLPEGCQRVPFCRPPPPRKQHLMDVAELGEGSLECALEIKKFCPFPSADAPLLKKKLFLDCVFAHAQELSPECRQHVKA